MLPPIADFSVVVYGLIAELGATGLASAIGRMTPDALFKAQLGETTKSAQQAKL